MHTIFDDGSSQLYLAWPGLGILASVSLNREDLNLKANDVCNYCTLKGVFPKLCSGIRIVVSRRTMETPTFLGLFPLLKTLRQLIQNVRVATTYVASAVCR